MGEYAIRVLALAIGAAALVVIPTVTPATAATINGKHFKKHRNKIQNGPGFGEHWSAGRARPVARSSRQAGPVCPGIARGFECATWPPPMEDDPDRKVSRF
jgi:hypothetical protein